VILQFTLPGEQLRVGVAVFNERGFALAVCAGEGYQTGSETVKINRDFLFLNTLHNADSALEPEGHKFPLAFGLCRALRDFRVQAFDFSKMAVRDRYAGVLRPDLELSSRGTYRRDFGGANGFDRNIRYFCKSL
jgi:hypothetical protein